MRQLISAVILLFCLCAAGVATNVANVPLPCDSYYQVLSPDGVQLAVPCKDRSLRVVSVPEGKELRVFHADQRANAVVYSVDGQWMAVGFHDGTIEVTSTKTATPAKQWQASPRRIDSLYFFPDSKRLVVGPTDSAGQVWELADPPKLQATLPFGFGGINACALSPDGKLLVIAGNDTVLRWFDTGTWQETAENLDFLLETFALAFTLDGKKVLAGGADSRITVLDAATAKQFSQFPPEAGSYIVAIDLFGEQKTSAIYLDDAGEKPPHQQIWQIGNAKSIARPTGVPSCEGVVGGKLWVCAAEGKTLRIAQYE